MSAVSNMYSQKRCEHEQPPCLSLCEPVAH